MFRSFILIALPFVFVSSAIAQEDLEAKLKENCKVKWETNYRMIKYCIEQQNEAWGKLSARLDKYPEDSEERNIISRCAAKWRGESGGYNFRMVEYCSENQLQAYRELK